MYVLCACLAPRLTSNIMKTLYMGRPLSLPPSSLFFSVTLLPSVCVCCCIFIYYHIIIIAIITIIMLSPLAHSFLSSFTSQPSPHLPTPLHGHRLYLYTEPRTSSSPTDRANFTRASGLLTREPIHGAPYFLLLLLLHGRQAEQQQQLRSLLLLLLIRLQVALQQQLLGQHHQQQLGQLLLPLPCLRGRTA